MTAAPASRHLRGFVLLAGSQVLARVMTVLTLSAVARALGVETFGAIGFASAVVTYFMLAVDAGIDLVGMQHVARGDRVEGDVASLFLSRLVLAAMSMGLLCAAAPILVPDRTWLPIVLAQGLSMFSFAGNVKWAMQALERNGPVAASFLVTQGLYLLGVLALVHGPGDAERVPLLFFASDLAGAAVVGICYLRTGRRLLAPRSIAISRSLLREALPLAGTRALRAVTINADLLLLGLFGTPLAIGLYTAVTRVILALRELGDLYYVPLFPELSRAARESGERFAAVAASGLRTAALFVFPVAVIGWLRGGDVLALLFGETYRPAALAFALSLSSIVLVLLTGAYRLGLVAFERHRTLLFITLAGAVVNVASNAALIPRYSIVGGAVSALVAELLTVVLCAVALRASVVVLPFAPIARAGISAAGMGVLIWLLPRLPFPVTAAIGVLCYGLLALATGALQPAELARIARDTAGAEAR
ncbi:MAG: flippase [Acidobacteriota bacterium]